MGEEGRELQKPEIEEPEVIEAEVHEAVEPRELEPSRERGGFPDAPLHSLSSLVTVALDGVWSVPEFVSATSIAGLPALPVLSVGSGLMCMTAVTLLQRFVSKESWGASIAKGFAMGVIAGVPFPFTGTAAGSVLLLWSGAHALFGRKQLPPPQ
jgi:hypothetical protein